MTAGIGLTKAGFTNVVILENARELAEVSGWFRGTVIFAYSRTYAHTFRWGLASRYIIKYFLYFLF